MRIVGTQELVIAADPGTLWTMISDVTRTPEWSPDLISTVWLDPGPAVGARFESVNRMPLVRRWRSRATVTECDPGRRFAFGVGADPENPNTTWTWDFLSADGGTIVRLSYEMRHEPWIVLVYYRLTGRADHVRRSVDVTLRRLKAAAEAR